MRKRNRTGITTVESIFGLLERCNKHQKTWVEADLYEENGGKACKECIEKSRPTKYKKKSI